MKNKCIIIIPAFKPSAELPNLIKELSQHFKNIVIVDDGSGESFSDIFDATDKMGCIVLHHYTNLGKGRALKTAFNYCLSLKKAGYQGVITVDADGQHKLADIVSVYETMIKDKDSIILGARDFSGSNIPFRSKFGNTMTKHVFHWLCGIHINDTQTGLRGIPFQFLDMLCHVDGEKYEYETNMLLKCKDENIDLREISIETVYENDNDSSHFNPFRDSLKIYQTILKYSISSLLATVIDFILFYMLNKKGMKIMYAIYIARLCSMMINFMINRKLVFGIQGDFKKQFVKYIILVAISGTLSGMMIELLTHYVGAPAILCKGIVETLLYFVNYYVQNTFIFIREGKKANGEYEK